MKKSPLHGLVIRTAVVATPSYGLIYASDPKRERKQEPHTLVFAFEDGRLTAGDYNYSAHSAGLIARPCAGIVDVAEAGYYTANTERELFAADLFSHSKPPSARRRTRGLRGVYAVAGVAYALGLRGMVYRLSKVRHARGGGLRQAPPEDLLPAQRRRSRAVVQRRARRDGLRWHGLETHRLDRS